MALSKFGREYLLTIQVDEAGDKIEFNYPLTLEFDIHRKLYSSLNTGNFRLYNLSALHRNQIRFSAWNVGTYRQIQLRAGYSTTLSLPALANLPIVFQGNITQASSKREGPNFITTIEALDGGFAFNNPTENGNPLPSFPAGTTNQSIITTLANQLPETTLGSIGAFGGSSATGASFSGTPQEALSQYTGNGFFIDNEVVNCLNTTEVIESPNIPLINAQAGLLNTPALEQYWLYFDMIFEPRFQVGQLVELQSTTDFLFQGQAKVMSIQHRGVISGALCGEAITTVGLDLSTQAWLPVPRAIA
jgi:hypothetical protein